MFAFMWKSNRKMFLCKYFLYIITRLLICFRPVYVHETMLFESVADTIFWILFSK